MRQRPDGGEGKMMPGRDVHLGLAVVAFVLLCQCAAGSQQDGLRKNQAEMRQDRKADSEGGSPAAAADYPYVVSLRIEGQYAKDAECAGVIVDHNWVLTAAHCLDKSQKKTDVVLEWGSTYRGSGRDVKSIEYCKHGDFSSARALSYDLAMIQVINRLRHHQRQRDGCRVGSNRPAPGHDADRALLGGDEQRRFLDLQQESYGRDHSGPAPVLWRAW
jgi:hypothetical protein